MKHLNSNLLCAVAIKTTGPDPKKHELLEIAIIVLSPDCKVSKKHMPFNILFRPEKIQRAAYSLKNELVTKCMGHGVDLYDAAEMLDDWFEKLELRRGKQIMVLNHSWAKNRGFIEDWIQPTSFEKMFSKEYRDPQSIGLYINDRCDFRNEPCTFPKVKLSYMCSVQKLDYEQGLPTVIDECAGTIELYRSLILAGIH